MLPVPFVGPLQRLISSGVIVRISGCTPPTANILNVNLQCGPLVNPRDDVAFHLSANFSSLKMTMNSILDNRWGPPEYYGGQFPFVRGQAFSIDVICDENAFLVNVNGNTTARFEHRMDPSRINHLAIDGDVVLRNVELFDGKQRPIGSAGSPNVLSPAGMPPMPPYHPSTIKYQTSGDVPEAYPVGWFPCSNHLPDSHLHQLGRYPPQSMAQHLGANLGHPGLYQQPSPVPSPNQRATPFPQLASTNPGNAGSYQQLGVYQHCQTTPYLQTPGPLGCYPQLPGTHSQKTAPSSLPAVNPSQAPHPQQSGRSGTPASPVPPSSQLLHRKTFLDKVGLGSLGGMVGGAASSLGVKGKKKLGKLANKVREKALKLGIPVARSGLGTSAIKKSSRSHGRSSKSSSSSNE